MQARCGQVCFLPGEEFGAASALPSWACHLDSGDDRALPPVAGLAGGCWLSSAGARTAEGRRGVWRLESLGKIFFFFFS